MQFVSRWVIEDFDVVLEVLSGNRDSYAHLVRKYEGKVRGHCLGMLGNMTQAEDAAQEVFLKAYQALAKFRGDASFSTWLYRITHFHCLDILKSASRRRTESWDALLEKEGEKAESFTASSGSKNFEENSENTELLMQILSQLPEKSREVITLREMQELSYEEISQTLGCTLDAVKARLRRARQELAEKARHLVKL